MRDIEKVPVVAYRVSLPGEPDLGTWLSEINPNGPDESSVLHEPLILQSDHLTALTSAQEEADALYGALTQCFALAIGHAATYQFNHDLSKPHKIHQKAIDDAQAAITAYEAKRAKPEGSNQ